MDMDTVVRVCATIASSSRVNANGAIVVLWYGSANQLNEITKNVHTNAVQIQNVEFI